MAHIKRSIVKTRGFWGMIDTFAAHEEIRTLGDDPAYVAEIRRTAYAQLAAEFYQTRLAEAQEKIRQLEAGQQAQPRQLPPGEETYSLPAPPEWLPQPQPQRRPEPAPVEKPRFRVFIDGEEY